MYYLQILSHLQCRCKQAEQTWLQSLQLFIKRARLRVKGRSWVVHLTKIGAILCHEMEAVFGVPPNSQNQGESLEEKGILLFNNQLLWNSQLKPKDGILEAETGRYSVEHAHS